MSYTARPASETPTTRIFTLKVTGLRTDDLDENDLERIIAVAVAERIESTVTVDADELPF